MVCTKEMTIKNNNQMFINKHNRCNKNEEI